jgi:deoxyribodipyrimidine photo-lyase
MDLSLLSRWRQSYISELAWREFWQHIAHYFPETMQIEFQEKRRDIRWINDELQFQAWCEWRTGYPIVDAAMKQLTTINWMHWRARMIVASFLTKHLLIDWRWWEEYFARYLIDYDRNVNMWNRQWSASVWADPKPLRIFSPISQAQRFDPSGDYTTHYLPQLSDELSSRLQDPIKYTLDYIAPIVDHKTAYHRARAVYKW